ncbi:MAG: single-stranded-DNA-specific exonuclease RecJ [Anaerorhabdus sp.]
MNNIIENYSSLTQKVIAFNHCTEKQVQQLLEKPTALTENNSTCLLEAIKFILAAKERNEKVFIGGDYDADGICATTILYDALTSLGLEVGYYIPDRIKEGYGLQETVVQQAYDKGYSLIITVDNGVSATQALKKAKELGISVIVTDHHEYTEKPECDIFVHPKEMDQPFQTLAGAGVALQLAEKLGGAKPLHIALAAIATMGDVVELWDENRVIVRLGLDLINSTEIPVIQALFSNQNKIRTEQDLSFQIVPKLNATGRLRELANPNQVVRYFLLTQISEIQKTALKLAEVNEKRKEKTLQMSVIAEKNIGDEPFIILNDSRYHEGIIGILASKLATKYHRPTLVLTEGEYGYKGSGRSIAGFNMQQFFLDGFDEFLHFGGHSQAIGFTVDKTKYEQFKEKVQTKFKIAKFEAVEADLLCEINMEEISNESFEEYRKLAPFGQGFQDPLFSIVGLEVEKTVWIKQKFVKLIFKNGWEGICFDPEGLSFENFRRVIANLVVNQYGKGKEKFSISIKNIE